MLRAGTFVMAEVDLRENPWATAGVVADLDGGEQAAMLDLVPVLWPENGGVIAWELGWTLREVSGHGHSSVRDNDVSIKDQQRIDAVEWERM